MCDLPGRIIRVLRPFEPVFSGRVWALIVLLGLVSWPGAARVLRASIVWSGSTR